MAEDKKVTSLYEQLDETEAKVDEKATSIHEQLDEIEAKVDELSLDVLKMLQDEMEVVSERVARIEHLIEYDILRPVKSPLERLEGKLDEILRKLG